MVKQVTAGKGALMILFVLFVWSCSTGDDPKVEVKNEFVLDGVVFEIENNMYWEEDGVQGGEGQLRLTTPLQESDLKDLIVISPVSGPSSLDGTYVYSQTGDIGTYDLTFIHATDGEEQFVWYTRGELGTALEIRSTGRFDGVENYRILLPEFKLNYGYWDYLAGQWVSQGFMEFQLSYEGPVTGL